MEAWTHRLIQMGGAKRQEKKSLRRTKAATWLNYDNVAGLGQELSQAMQLYERRIGQTSPGPPHVVEGLV